MSRKEKYYELAQTTNKIPFHEERPDDPTNLENSTRNIYFQNKKIPENYRLQSPFQLSELIDKAKDSVNRYHQGMLKVAIKSNVARKQTGLLKVALKNLKKLGLKDSGNKLTKEDEKEVQKADMGLKKVEQFDEVYKNLNWDNPDYNSLYHIERTARHGAERYEKVLKAIERQNKKLN